MKQTMPLVNYGSVAAEAPVDASDPSVRRSGKSSVKKFMRRHLEALEVRFPIQTNYELGPYVHWRGNSLAPMHRWLRYREAYSPELIDKLSLGRRILDPFSGCGSIPIGAAARGRTSMGIDLNPIAAFSTKVKLRPLAEAQLARVRRFVDQLPSLLSAHLPTEPPKLSIADKVFEPQILDCVLRARAALEDAFANDSDSRDFVLLAWLSILESVGSYFKEGNGIKYRNKKRRQGRYENRREGDWQLVRFGPDQTKFFLHVFRRQLLMMLEDASVWSAGQWDRQTVVEGSAFELSKLAGRRKFDSIIFSPPYANRFDYFESFKVELWFGGFVRTYDELGRLRKSSLRSHLGANLARPTRSIEPLERLISLMDRDASSWRMGVADLVRGYFEDIRLVLDQCKKVLPKGRCHIVVGNSAFAGVIIPTDALTALVGHNAGFKSARIVETRHLTVAPQQRSKLSGFENYMRESIVTLER